MWVSLLKLRLLNTSEHRFAGPFKVMQKHFLKNNSVCYIFNSRIENTPAHLRARQSIYKALFGEQSDKA